MADQEITRAPLTDKTRSLRLVACPRPFSVDRIDRQVTAGGSIADIMRETGLDPDPIYARVFIDDVLVPKAYWEKVRPKAGHTLTVRVIPTGSGGGKDVLRIVAMIAIIAAAIFLGPEFAGFLGFEAGTPGFLAASAAITAGTSIGGSLRMNACIPPPRSQPGPREELPRAA